MISGPKTGAGDFDPAPAFPGAHALWAVRAGCPVRNLWRVRAFRKRSPRLHTNPENSEEGSRDPRQVMRFFQGARAGFSFLAANDTQLGLFRARS
jgi:hypothetical protein